MSLAQTEPSVVNRCIAGQGGRWLILTRDGQAAITSRELPQGTQVVVRDGKAYRPK